MAESKRTIVVSGMIAGDPHQGGATWAVLQYLLGLARLGHDVYLVEPLTAAALRPAGVGLAESINAAYFRQVCVDFHLERSAALLLAGTRQTVGLSYQQLGQVSRRADVLLNISGMLVEQELIGPIPIRVYLDLDPAFNQLWHSTQGIDRHLAGHTHFVTVGLALNSAACPVPTCGLPWIPTLPPVVLAEWPVAGPITCDAFTTVGNWRGYGSIEYNGVLYGQKAHSLRPLMALPTRTRMSFQPALAIHADETRDLEALSANGWRLLEPAQVAGTPALYRAFLQGSRAEFGIAKSGYVVSRCGWFSDRSACYLACGRPVLAQDTGFSRFVPSGEGLLAFHTLDDALAGIEAIAADYPRHARAARALAEEFFDSDKILAGLLERIGGVP
jgi:hypothetical protein